MNRYLATVYLFALVAAPVICPPLGNAQGGSQGPGQPGSTGGGGRQTRPSQPSRPMDQTQGPVYVSGRVVMDTGQPPSESVSVELNCGMRALQAIHTDLGGYFTFSLGTGVQSNMDFSASNDNPMSSTAPRTGVLGRAGTSLTGCELRAAVPGYHPLSYTLSQHAEMGRIEVGTLRLRRIAGVEGSAISVTSLMVPGSARKEYEKAQKEVRNNRPDAAKQHLEKAVAAYDKYAAAWNELGRIYSSKRETDKAREAFQKAIAADPQYTPPYLSLASIGLQSEQYEQAVDTATKLLQLDPSIGYASFIQAVGNYNLNRLDAAEKSALDAEKGPHENIPQVHALLAQIFLQKQDYRKAASHMRVYLQESPNGQFADQMKKGLEEIRGATEQAANQPSGAPEQAPAEETAPGQAWEDPPTVWQPPPFEQPEAGR